MSFPPSSPEQWRAQVDEELAGKSFDKTLVHETFEGIAIAPLYTSRPAALPVLDDRAGGSRLSICMRHERGARASDLAADIGGGADALWIPIEASEDLAGHDLAGITVLVDANGDSVSSALPQALARGTCLVGFDPLKLRVEGRASWATLQNDAVKLGASWRNGAATGTFVVSALPYHEAGADAVDEIALCLSTGARYLTALLETDLSPERIAQHLLLRVAVGRDTFLELCKVRALRFAWRKLMAAIGAPAGAVPRVHAVCSARTLTARDPWVNMLRVTTQVFSAALGGADLVTPNAFDALLETQSALGRRVARNTGLVLREESALGRVADPGAGSYYFDTLTDALARAAWSRFRLLEDEGGIVQALERGTLDARFEATRRARAEGIAKRKTPVLGVSEFANLDEALPSPPRADIYGSGPGLRRDAAPFEALRAQAERHPHEVLLVTLGSAREARPRAGFASSFFAAGGLRTRETSTDEACAVACLCGTDERYASEAVARARTLKAVGCARVVLAGRPGALEAELRAAGVDAFIFAGCDVVGVLEALMASSQ
jgi:methylmalonyl-CoA mutase